MRFCASWGRIAPEFGRPMLAMTNDTRLIRILSVDDHPLLRSGIAALVDTQPDMRMVGEASNGKEAVLLHRQLNPDVTLMDLQMPDVSGLDAIISIRTEQPAARIIVLTTYAGDVLAQRALKAGAQAYILKNLVDKELLETIRCVHRGMKKIQPDVAVQLANHTAEPNLSAREVEVLTLVAAGNSNRLIAAQLSIDEETAKSHVKSILAKLGARDRTHAVTLGLRRGVIAL